MSDKLFNKAYEVSSALYRELYLKNSNPSLTDRFMFQISTFIQGILRQYIYPDFNKFEYSLDHLYLFRCIIECLSIVKMYDSGDIDKESESLLMDFDYLVEYPFYSKYRDLKPGMDEYFKKRKSAFYSVKEKYRTKCEVDHKDFKDLMNSRLPWLKGNYSYKMLVGSYLPDLLDDYIRLGYLVHPNHLLVSIAVVNETNLADILSLISKYFLEFQNKFYPNLEVRIVDMIQVKYDLIIEKEEILPLLYYAKEVHNAIYKMGNDMIKYHNIADSRGSYYLHYSSYVYNLLTDYIHSKTEVMKARFKPFIELCAMESYIMLVNRRNQDFKERLILAHSYYHYQKMNNEDTKDVVKDSYDIFKSNYKYDGSIDDFKRQLDQTLGFFKRSCSINKFVYDFIDRYFEGEENKLVKMTYDESQSISHANGYMLTSTTSAFDDIATIIFSTVKLITDFTTEIIKDLDEEIKTEGSKLNKLKYDLKKNLQKFAEGMTYFLKEVRIIKTK